MNKNLLLVGTAMLAGLASAHGAAALYGNVNDADFSHATVIDSSNSLVPNGTGYIGVGMFAGLNDAAIAALDSAGLAAAFTAYASSTFGGEGVGNSEGLVLAQSSAVIGDNFNNQSVYFLIGDQAGFAGSGKYAVVKENSVFPDDDPNSPVPLPVKWEIADVQEADILIGSFLAPGVVSPTFDGLVGGSVKPRASVVLIPEPSAFIFSLAGLALIFRRRR
jgi:hypothetical protein